MKAELVYIEPDWCMLTLEDGYVVGEGHQYEDIMFVKRAIEHYGITSLDIDHVDETVKS